MTLSHIFTIGSSVFLTLSSLTEIMLSELALIAWSIVNFCAAKVVVGLPVHDNSILLCHHLILVSLWEAWLCIWLLEKLVILIRRGAIICRLLQAHFEICNTHRLRIANLGHLLQGELLWSVCLPSWGCVRHLRWPVLWHIESEIWIARLFHKFSVL